MTDENFQKMPLHAAMIAVKSSGLPAEILLSLLVSELQSWHRDHVGFYKKRRVEDGLFDELSFTAAELGEETRVFPSSLLAAVARRIDLSLQREERLKKFHDERPDVQPMLNAYGNPTTPEVAETRHRAFKSLQAMLDSCMEVAEDLGLAMRQQSDLAALATRALRAQRQA